MATPAKGPRRKLPAAATAVVPAAAARVPASPAPMSALEAAPVLEAAHDRADIAAAPLVGPEALVAVEPVSLPDHPIPATVSPKPDVDPAPTDATSVFTPVAAPTVTADATKDIMMDATTNFDSAAKSQAMFADMNERTKGAMEKGAKFFAELTEFNKGNLEAMVESSKIAVRGMETMGQDAAAYAKSAFETSTAAMREFAAIKSPTELMKLQADYARQAFDTMVAHASRSTEASLKLAGEVAQPISNRVALAADTMKVAA